MRRIVFVPLAAALILASTSAAALQPVRRNAHGTSNPRLRAGTIHIPAGHARGRVTVLVDLPLPPLAAYGGGLFTRSGTARLDVGSRRSRTYLARVARQQRAAAAELRRRIPSARITNRYRIILNGFALTLPATKLPALARLSFVTKVYPSLRV